jgi:hypothetical protein
MPEGARCKECQRLWADYVSAVLEQVRQDRHHYFAALTGDPGQLLHLRSALDAATVAVKLLRVRIREHQELHQKAGWASA